MNTSASNSDYRDRSRVLTFFGILMLAGGAAVGMLAPLEMICFYWFSEEGRFAYEGFGFGSFMFGNIAAQIIGYYLIAAILIPLGYGHLKKRRWIRKLTIALTYAWLVAGAPLSLVVFFILAASKNLALPAAIGAALLLAAFYLILPALLIRFYNGQNVRLTLEAQEARSGRHSRVEELPTPILTLSLLYVLFIVMLHILILFNGMYPVFTGFRYGLPGIVLIDISVAALAVLTWGTLGQKRWAWWGAVLGLGLFTASTIWAFCASTFAGILDGLALPLREIEILDGIPAQGYHFAILAGAPMLVTWIILVASRRHFGRAT